MKYYRIFLSVVVVKTIMMIKLVEKNSTLNEYTGASCSVNEYLVCDITTLDTKEKCENAGFVHTSPYVGDNISPPNQDQYTNAELCEEAEFQWYYKCSVQATVLLCSGLTTEEDC